MMRCYRDREVEAVSLALAGVLLIVAALEMWACPSQVPPAGPPAVSVGDIVSASAAVLRGAGTALEASAGTWGACPGGVALVATADAAERIVAPAIEAAEAGALSVTLGPVTVDPGPCSGLPREPDIAGIEGARAEVESALSVWLPVAGVGVDLALLAVGDDRGACAVLTVLGDVLDPAGELAVGIAGIVEAPGEPLTVPGVTVDLSGCL